MGVGGRPFVTGDVRLFGARHPAQDAEVGDWRAGALVPKHRAGAPLVQKHRGAEDVFGVGAVGVRIIKAGDVDAFFARNAGFDGDRGVTTVLQGDHHAAGAVGAAVAFVVGVWASNVCIDLYGVEDPKQVVIDEIAGQWLVLAVVPPGWMEYALGFVLFRAFDILKPWPVSWADRTIKGGLGVMIDDILAAVYAIIVLRAVATVMGA